MIFKKVWFMLLSFSCDDTCLSWIEFIFDLSMWASIFVYIFEVIMEAMMMILHTLMLWYETLYDDNACDNDVHSMMLMHSYTIWCTCISYCDDALLCIMMYTWCWWCIQGENWDDDDVHFMMRMHTLWWWCIPMMMIHDDACLMFSESKVVLLVQ